MENNNTSESTTLEEDINSALSDILSTPNKGNYRCYEIARLLGNKLVVNGYKDVVVQTGIVQYDNKFLEEIFLEQLKQDDDGFADILEKESRLNPTKGKTPRIFHSWVEVGETIVDYQNSIPASRDTSYQTFLLVKEMDELVDKVSYNPHGGEINLFGRTFIYTPLFYFTKLRI